MLLSKYLFCHIVYRNIFKANIYKKCREPSNNRPNYLTFCSDLDARNKIYLIRGLLIMYCTYVPSA